MSYRFHTSVILGASAIVFFTNFFATKAYLYWYIWWFDIMMHFVSGIIVGYFGMFIATLIWKKSLQLSQRKKLLLFVVALLTSLLIGMIWEILEYSMGLIQNTPELVFDTVSDLIDDVSGGILAWALANRIFIRGLSVSSLSEASNKNINDK